MERVEISEELRVSLAAFEEAQRKMRTAEPRRYTYLLAVKGASPGESVSAKRVFRFCTE